MSVDEELVLLTDRLTVIRSTIQQLQDAETAMVAAITAKISEGPVRDDTGKTIAVVKPPGLRFNAATAAKALPKDAEHRVCSLDSKKLKTYDPELYEAHRVPSGTPKVEIVDDHDGA